MGIWHEQVSCKIELCEPMSGLVDLGAEVYGFDGSRDLLTIIADAEKDPLSMGFSLIG